MKPTKLALLSSSTVFMDSIHRVSTGPSSTSHFSSGFSSCKQQRCHTPKGGMEVQTKHYKIRSASPLITHSASCSQCNSNAASSCFFCFIDYGSSLCRGSWHIRLMMEDSTPSVHSIMVAASYAP